MAAPRPADPDALVLVRNAVAHDARVLRAARALAVAGLTPLLVGVETEEHPAGPDAIDGLPVLRLAPSTPLAPLRRRRGRPRPVAAPAPARRAPRASVRVSLPTRLYRLAVTADFYRRGILLALRTRPRLVHADDYNAMWIGVAAKLLCGSALVYDAHELWPDRNGRWEWRPWLLLCEALFVRLADAVITTSPGYAGAIARRYRVPRPALVRNLPERPPGAAPRAAAPAAARPPRIVYAGGVLRHRGLEEAIAALALVPDVQLRVVGPGAPAYLGELHAAAARHGVADRLRLDPPVAPGRVAEEIADADAGLCLIQPVCRSYELTLPNKLYEYAAAGLPVLASDLAVIGATVREEGFGIPVPPADPEAIAAGIRRILDPERNAALRAAARRAAASATWSQERERLLAVYRALL